MILSYFPPPSFLPDLQHFTHSRSHFEQIEGGGTRVLTRADLQIVSGGNAHHAI